MCDGQIANDCDFISLTEFESTLNERLAKLDDEFLAINDVLKTKKEAFIEMYRKDPRKLHDEAVSRFRQYVGAFDPTNPTYPEEVSALETIETVETTPSTPRTIVCSGFSDDKKDVTVSSCKRSVKGLYGVGYCFLQHPKIEGHQVLTWKFRVPKFSYYIGNGYQNGTCKIKIKIMN